MMTSDHFYCHQLSSGLLWPTNWFSCFHPQPHHSLFLANIPLTSLTSLTYATVLQETIMRQLTEASTILLSMSMITLSCALRKIMALSCALRKIFSKVARMVLQNTDLVTLLKTLQELTLFHPIPAYQSLAVLYSRHTRASAPLHMCIPYPRRLHPWMAT